MICGSYMYVAKLPVYHWLNDTSFSYRLYKLMIFICASYSWKLFWGGGQKVFVISLPGSYHDNKMLISVSWAWMPVSLVHQLNNTSRWLNWEIENNALSRENCNLCKAYNEFCFDPSLWKDTRRVKPSLIDILFLMVFDELFCFLVPPKGSLAILMKKLFLSWSLGVRCLKVLVY